MKTYKFLAAGAKGPITGFQWPVPQLEAPGEWVVADGPLEACARGAHVCRPSELAFWISDELWETEIDGERLEGFDCLVAERARLVRRFDDWQHGGALRFLQACVQHAREVVARAPAGLAAAVQPYLEDAAECVGEAAIAGGAYSAALAVAKLEPAQLEAAYRRERAWQADFIARVSIGA